MQIGSLNYYRDCEKLPSGIRDTREGNFLIHENVESLKFNSNELGSNKNILGGLIRLEGNNTNVFMKNVNVQSHHSVDNYWIYSMTRIPEKTGNSILFDSAYDCLLKISKPLELCQKVTKYLGSDAIFCGLWPCVYNDSVARRTINGLKDLGKKFEINYLPATCKAKFFGAQQEVRGIWFIPSAQERTKIIEDKSLASHFSDYR